jgi:two-component system, NtrC family, sensor kinase
MEKMGDFQKAFDFHRRSLEISESLDAKFELTQGLLGLAKTQRKRGDFEAAIASLQRAELLANEIDAKSELMDLYMILAEVQALSGNYKAAYENGLNSQSLKEEIANSSTDQMKQNLQFKFELDKKEAEIELLQKDVAVFNQRIIIFSSLGALLMFVIISISLYRNNLSNQKANRLLQKQKEEIHAQRENVETAYDQLKSTQAQLIQSEKMASLGELTAGIAHEIQNPLNFVNNFSEVSTELLDEMNEELEKGDIEEAKAISSDIKQNLEKINHHGKRADAIVKGMLEHSRTSSGEKVLTDINALAEEYLRLSYHGMRAKDKSFNVDFATDYDPNLPKVNVVPQEIGRVLLNIINNAFQACATPRPPEGGVDPTPTVIVKTNTVKFPSGDLGVEISIDDNGPGIPDAIKDKIFQPFFTTKPTGQGTGLGLSLSYDIVKAHGGDFRVETKEGEGSTFIISLPKTPEA